MIPGSGRSSGEGIGSVQFSSIALLCLTLCNPMDCSMPGLRVHHRSLLKLMSIESMMPSNHLILCHPLLPLPLIFRSIRIFSNESSLCIRWPKYCSVSFSISPSNECSGSCMPWPKKKKDQRVEGRGEERSVQEQGWEPTCRGGYGQMQSSLSH